MKYKSTEEQVDALMQKMTTEEKIRELESCMADGCTTMVNGSVELIDDYQYDLGNYRNPAFFAHDEKRLTPSQAVKLNNDFQKKTLQKSRLKIPALLHGEACHGAQWCDATVFPQMIGFAASWDADLTFRAFSAIAKEVKVAGIRQVLAPVVNIARDPRWGRMQETCGEDPYLSSRIGVACSKAFENQDVVSTPKHFVDNLGDGGRDSLAPTTSWRIAREVYFPPFKACIQQAGARSVMPGYNSFDGTSCHADKRLLTDILRDEWGFDGIVVSDYGGVKGIVNRHFLTDDNVQASAMGLAAGVDVENFTEGELRELHQRQELDIEQLDRSVARVLKLKIELGLLENPFGDPEKADEIICCGSHIDLSLESARRSIVLLKNQNDILPLSKNIDRIGLFGPAANVARLGGYSGPSRGWRGDGAITPFDGIKTLLQESNSATEVLLHENTMDPAKLASSCDAAIFFGTIREGEGKDRCHCDLPDGGPATSDMSKSLAGDNIVLNFDFDQLPPGNQEQTIQQIAATGTPTIVVLLAGAPVICDNWIDQVQGLLMAWYPGQQGGKAIAEILFGHTNPSAKLPVTWPKHHGQLPTYYNHKPTGRKLIYCDNDGKPLYPFGYGMSYTKFDYQEVLVEERQYAKDENVTVQATIKNTGKYPGIEIVQAYIHRVHAGVVVPVKELKAFQTVELQPNESKTVTMEITPEDLSIWDIDMNFVNPAGWVEIMVGSSSDDIHSKKEIRIK